MTVGPKRSPPPSNMIVTASTGLTLVGFLFNLLAAWIPGWGSSCVNCNYAGTVTEVCYYIGLFDYCQSVYGMQTCADCTCGVPARALAPPPV